MKLLLFSLFLFAAGFATNHLLQTKNVIPLNRTLKEHTCLDLERAKNTLISISKNEYAEYLTIKDQKLKYDKANELLGKIMLLFLADVGFHLKSNDTFFSANQLMKDNQHEIPSGHPIQSPSRSKEKYTSSDRDVHSTLGQNTRTILDKAVIEDPKVIFAAGGEVTKKQIGLLEGRYTGSIKYINTKRANLDVVWELAPDNSKEELVGQFLLSIHGPGTNSDSNTSGSITNIISMAKSKNGFLVSGCGQQCYLQLFYNVEQNSFFGNYYESSGKKFERVGYVELNK